MIGWVAAWLPRYNIYATLRLNNKSVLYSPCNGFRSRERDPVVSSRYFILCHILCVIYSQRCIELVDKTLSDKTVNDNLVALKLWHSCATTEAPEDID